MANTWGNNGNSDRRYLAGGAGGSQITAHGVCSHELKTLAPWKESYDQPRQHIKKLRHYFANKGPSSQSYGFSSSHVWMWKLDYKESWEPKNWCFWTVVLEKTLERPLDCKEIQPVNSKGNQSWILIGRTNAEAETPILWPTDAKNWLSGKDLDAGKDWRQEEKRTTEDEMVGWHHRLDEYEFKQALGVGDRQVSLVCCSPWGCKDSDTTECQFSHALLFKACMIIHFSSRLISSVLDPFLRHYSWKSLCKVDCYLYYLNVFQMFSS